MHNPVLVMTETVGYNEEVREARANGRPLVALESTIIAHGMPYPQNVETALEVEALIRRSGAVPATIAVMDGQLRAGLAPAEIDRLGKMGSRALKVSRRDLPVVVARRQTGAATVAATMIIAAMADIRVFATGGIGGVHRGGQDSLDISADLEELAQTNVVVVSAGAKSILDLGLTLEYLETRGVPVLGYQTGEFPAFFTRKSGHPLEVRVESPDEVARIMRAKWEIGLQGGMVVANPIPEDSELDYAHAEAAIHQALQEASAQGIRGKAITPFLLARVEQLTAGASLQANIELVKNNALLAAQISCAWENGGKS